MKTINIYQFNELTTEAAKERARQWWREVSASEGYSWSQDAIQSLKKLAEHFGGKVKDYQIDFFDSSPSSACFDMPEDMTKKEIQSRLAQLGSYNKRTGKGHGDCKLTGFCADEDAIDGFRAAFRRGERNLNELMQEAFKTWLKSSQSDARGQLENEYIDDILEANEYDFFEDGRRAA